MFQNRLFLPIVNFMISSTALFFQITVLLPWQEKLSKQMIELQKLIIDKTK